MLSAFVKKMLFKTPLITLLTKEHFFLNCFLGVANTDNKLEKRIAYIEESKLYYLDYCFGVKTNYIC